MVLNTKRVKLKHLHSQRAKHCFIKHLTLGLQLSTTSPPPALASQHAAGVCKDVHTHFNINAGTTEVRKNIGHKKIIKQPRTHFFWIIPFCMWPFHSISTGPSFGCPREGTTTYPLGCCGFSGEHLHPFCFHEAVPWSSPAIFSLQAVAVLHVNLLSRCMFVGVRASECVHACTLPDSEHEAGSTVWCKRSLLLL